MANEKELKPVFGVIIAGINVAAEHLGISPYEVADGIASILAKRGAREFNGYIEPLTEKMRGYGRYKYRVVGRNGLPVHHTNDYADAEWYLNECRNFWKKKG